MQRLLSVAALAIVVVLGVVVSWHWFSPSYVSGSWSLDNGELSSEQMKVVLAKLKQQQLPIEVYDSQNLPQWLGERLSELDFSLESSDVAVDSERLLLYTRLLTAIHHIGEWQQPPGWYRDRYLTSDRNMNSAYLRLCRLWFKQAEQRQWNVSPMQEQVLAAVIPASMTGPAACLSSEQLLAIYRGIQRQQQGVGTLAPAVLQRLWLAAYQQPLTDEPDISLSGDLVRLLASDDPATQIASAEVIGQLSLPAALPGLRFHLFASNNERVQVAILNAMNGYGSRIRPYVKQLRLLQRHTNSGSVQSAIQQLIEKSNGQ